MLQQHTRVAAYGLVTHNHNILLCRSSGQVQNWQGYWTLPGGGLDFGEHPEDAMEREVMKKTALPIYANGSLWMKLDRYNW